MEGGGQVSRRKQRLIQQSAWHMPERGSELMEARCAAQNHLQTRRDGLNTGYAKVSTSLFFRPVPPLPMLWSCTGPIELSPEE